MAAVVESQVSAQKWSEEVNPTNKAALLAWVKETGIQLVQINGQRKYGGPPPGWADSVPPPGTEVFIGKIPQDIYEDKLIPLFQSVGRLYEFRLMMTFSGLNRGFAYAKYMNRRSAQEAIGALNNFEIQPGYPILVCRSTDKCELCIDGLAPSVREHQLLPMLQELTTGVLSISLHPSPYKKQRLLAEVKYVSHQAAAIAKKSLVEGTLCLFGDEIEVDWLKPSIKQELHKGPLVPDGPEMLPFSHLWRDAPSKGPTELADCHMLSAMGSMVDYLKLVCEKLNVVDYLKLACERRQLGSPRFYTKCVQRNPEGWRLFWYQVTIPKCPSPFNGFIWIKPGHSRLEDHEEVKNTVALQLLQVLGVIEVDDSPREREPSMPSSLLQDCIAKQIQTLEETMKGLNVEKGARRDWLEKETTGGATWGGKEGGLEQGRSRLELKEMGACRWMEEEKREKEREEDWVALADDDDWTGKWVDFKVPWGTLKDCGGDRCVGNPFVGEKPKERERCKKENGVKG